MVYIFQVAEVGYRRLTPGQSVGLKHAGYVISYVRTEKVRSHSEYHEDIALLLQQ